MSLLTNLSKSLYPPLRSFVTELSGHIDFFRNLELDQSSTAEEKELVRRKIEGRFHLIRGASGFFKLEALRDLATKGEHSFQKAKGDEEKFDELTGEFLQSAIAEIEHTYAQLTAELG